MEDLKEQNKKKRNLKINLKTKKVGVETIIS
jgi:hypothetical protein